MEDQEKLEQLLKMDSAKGNFLCGPEQPRPENATTARSFRKKLIGTAPLWVKEIEYRHRNGKVIDEDGVYKTEYWSNKEQRILTNWFHSLEEAQEFIEKRDIDNS